MFSTVYKMIFIGLYIDDTRYNIKDEFDTVNDIFNIGKAAHRKC